MRRAQPEVTAASRSIPRLGLAVAMATLLAACAQTPPPKPPLTVLGLWRVDQARTEPVMDRSLARLDFGADGALSGNTSCNTLRASYTLQGSALTISPVITTRKACPSLQMEQEDRILQALEAATTARVRDDGLLELRDAEGRGVLRGTRFDPAP